MKKRIISTVVFLIIFFVFAAGFYFYENYFKGAAPAVKESDIDIKKVINTTDMPLDLPKGFSIEIFADNLPDARVMLIDKLGNIWVSQTKQGKVTLLTVENGKVSGSQVIFDNLNNPHGLAVHPDDPFLLYIAETDKISRVPIYAEGELEKILDLPKGGRHYTRTIMFTIDKKLLISVGSSCDTCEEEDWRRASILIADDDGSNLKKYANGLRNSVFMTYHPKSLQVWATEMGRDFLGDNLPPEEINIIKRGKHYGWPYCYGRRVHDNEFDPQGEYKEFCRETAPAHITFQAHSAPLGLAFVPDSWPEEYQRDLLVAYHGSWNRTVPTGYKIARFHLNARNESTAETDFISGWLQNGNALGRPVDLKFDSEGNLYISDDKAGVIYKVTDNR